MYSKKIQDGETIYNNFKVKKYEKYEKYRCNVHERYKFESFKLRFRLFLYKYENLEKYIKFQL